MKLQFSILALAVLLVTIAAEAAAPVAGPSLSATVTPWRSVKFSWNIPNAQLYISPQPITSVAGMQPYVIKPGNLSLLWDTQYSYDPETDPAVLKTDDNTGWDPFPDLADGVWGDGSVSCNMTWGGGKKQFAPVFTLDKPYLISSINLLMQASSNDPNGKSTVEIFAGNTRNDLKPVKSEDVVLPRNTYGTVTVVIPTTLAKVVKIRMTTNDMGVNIGEVQLMGTNNYQTERTAEITDLAIGSQYYAAVAANGKMAITKITVPKVFDIGNLSESFGVNVHLETFYANMPDVEKAAKLIAQAGIKYVRWYNYGGHERVVNCLKKYGVGAYMLSYAPGTVAVGNGNEPELSKRTPAQVAEGIIDARAKAKQDNPMYVVGGPTCMASSYDYVDAVLKNLKPEQLDFFDFHPYVSANTDVYPGLERGVPENVLSLYQKWHKLLDDNGFKDKLFVPSEFGYSTYDGSSWAQPVSLDGQAMYLVRSYLAHISQGGVLNIWYDYRNDGTDPSNMEHNFGLVDNNQQPKLSYLAYQTMTKLLAEKRFAGMVPNTALPTFGYTFADPNGSSFVYAFVNATRRSVITLDKPATAFTLYDIYGHSLPVDSVTAKTTQIHVDGSPIYLVSKRAVKVVSAKSIPLPIKEAVTIKPMQSMATVRYPHKAVFDLQLANTYKKPVAITISATCAGFVQSAQKIVTLKSGASETVHLAATMKPTDTAVYPVKLVATAPGITRVENELYLYSIRKLTSDVEAYQVDINRDSTKEVVLENADLHVLITPSAGSRIFRLIDKRVGADQFYVPATAKSGLADISKNVAAGEYVTMSGFGGFICSAPFTINMISDANGVGVEMTSTVQGYEVLHRIQLLKANPDAVVQTYVIKNVSNEKKTFDLNSHPQFTPGGAIEFGKVDIFVPSGQQVKANTFKAFRGDEGSLEPDQGWWKVVNTNNGYTMRCDFDVAQARAVRQWHDGAFFNMELYFKHTELQPGQSATFNYTYTLTPKAQ
ncbi:MAG TPA: hypothetical protein VHV83_14405 [Armatimonadota bacterium]|nr:hypothetical protein [Armatimonadota bacterium]